MKKLLILLLLQISYANCQVDWLVSIGGLEDDYAYDVDCDAYGFTYCVGIFEGNDVNFAESGSHLESTTPFNQYNGFVRKSFSDGSLAWVKVLSSKCNVQSVEVKNPSESNAGYFVIAGFYFGTVDFAPGETPQTETASNVQDMFVAKYDLNGNYIWHRTYGGYGNDEVDEICIDIDDNVLLYGSFNSAIDFGNGNSFTTSNGNGVIHKMDEFGNDLWTVRLSSPVEVYTGGGIDTDSQGNVYATGNYSDDLILSSGENFTTLHPESANYDNRAFISKFDSNGVYIWSHVYGSDSSVTINGIGTKGTVYAMNLAIDSHNGVIVTGHSSRSIFFTPNVETQGGAYGKVFVLKLNENGNFKWLNSFGGDYGDRGLDIETDLDDNIYSTGYIGSIGDLDPSADSIIVSPGGYQLIYAQKTDSNGVLIDAKGFGSSCDHAIGYGIALDQNQNVYIAGAFEGLGWTYWNPPYGDIQVTDHGENDAILFKLDGYLYLLDLTVEDVQIYPNPANSFFQIKNHLKYESISVIDVYGKTIFSANNIEEQVYISDWEAGVYFVKLYKESDQIILRLVKT
jgi:hypothetical protein